MWPVVRSGDNLLILKREIPKKGEIGVYRLDGVLISHRLIKSKNGCLYFKGDNREKIEKIRKKNIEGKVILLRRITLNKIYRILLIYFPFIKRVLDKVLRICRY